MQLFDSHAHLDDDKFNADLKETAEKIAASDVSLLVDVGSNMITSEKAIKIAEQYPFVYAAVGIHPCDAFETGEEQNMQHLKAMAAHEKVVAIGETGLDYYWDDVDRETQKRGFIRQIALANELKLPLIVHNRDAHADTLSILKEYKPESAIIHCFSGSAEMAKELSKMGYYISFSGSVTFKNARQLPEAVKAVPLNRLLVETDSPYLAPEPKRGTRNDPTNVLYTAAKIADILNLPLEEVARITFENAKRVYKLK
mgnify:FL=1